MKPRVPKNTFPNQNNGLFANAEGGGKDFIPNDIGDKYATV